MSATLWGLLCDCLLLRVEGCPLFRKFYSFVLRPHGGRKSRLVFSVCACVKTPHGYSVPSSTKWSTFSVTLTSVCQPISRVWKMPATNHSVKMTTRKRWKHSTPLLAGIIHMLIHCSKNTTAHKWCNLTCWSSLIPASSKQCSFWLQNHPIVHRWEHDPALWPSSR